MQLLELTDRPGGMVPLVVIGYLYFILFVLLFLVLIFHYAAEWCRLLCVISVVHE
jgi:hypothetical protein